MVGGLRPPLQWSAVADRRYSSHRGERESRATMHWVESYAAQPDHFSRCQRMRVERGLGCLMVCRAFLRHFIPLPQCGVVISCISRLAECRNTHLGCHSEVSRSDRDGEESGPDQAGVSRARFLSRDCGIGMTTFTKAFQHPPGANGFVGAVFLARRSLLRVAHGLVCKSLTHVTEWVGFVVRRG
jgi:hypothetical protein